MDDAPGAEEAVFAAQPASVAAARRFVRKFVDRAAIDDDDGALADDAVLVVSELMANAVLHAGGPIRVRASATPGPVSELRVDVMDESPVTPQIRIYDADASTGRGLNLVARLSRSWGVDALPEGGKSVWAELVSGVRGGAAHDGAGAAPADPAPAVADSAMDVAFLAVPVELYLRLQAQNDGVLRELELLAFNADHVGRAIPSATLVELIERSRRYFNAHREGFRWEVAAAAGRGEATVDLVGRYAVTTVVPSAELTDLFEQAEAAAERGEMLVTPAPVDVASLRRWFVRELSGQLLEGRPPRPFGAVPPDHVPPDGTPPTPLPPDAVSPPAAVPAVLVIDLDRLPPDAVLPPDAASSGGVLDLDRIPEVTSADAALESPPGAGR